MSNFKINRLSTITILYWFLVLYFIVALVWWFIALRWQNDKMTTLLLNELRHDEPGYYNKAGKILDDKDRKTAQYILEGATFLGLLVLGAFFVYRPIRRQLTLSAQQQNFMMAVTHELKTPIAVIKLHLETFQKRRLEEQKQQKLLSTTLQEVERLNSLCNNILLASQLDAGEYKISRSEVDISAVAKRVFADFEARNPMRSFDGSFEDEVIVTGEEMLLEMMMSNLIENAIKYSPKDSKVTVDLSTRKSLIYFSVKDEGPGIAEEEKNKIFEKFYRAGNEVTRTTKGTGLGLYLCKQIAKDHHATISIVNSEPHGAIFTVTFRQAGKPAERIG